MSYKLIESMRLIASTDPIDAALDPQRAVRVAHEALAADDAARGTMREEFEAWCPYKGSPDPWIVWQAAWQASRAAAPQAGSPCGRDADWALAMAEALGTDSGFEVPIVPEAEPFRRLFAAVRAAAPQSVEPLTDDELPGMWSHSDLTGGATDCVSSPTAPTEAEEVEDAAPQSVEPVAWIRHDWSGTGQRALSFDGPPSPKPVRDEVVNPIWTPLYTSPPSAPTDAQWLEEAMRLADTIRFSEAPLAALRALRAHLSTRPAQAEEWIACSERLPNPDSGEVLVWLCESKMYAIDEWHTYREDPTGMGGPTLDMGLMWRHFDFDEVSHWRPLPAPPTKAKEQ